MIIAIARHYIRDSRASRLFHFYVAGLVVLFALSSAVYIHRYSDTYGGLMDLSQTLRRRATLEHTFAVLPANETSFISSADASILPDWLEIRPYEPVEQGGRLEPKSYLIDHEPLDWRIIIGIWCSLAALLFASRSLANRVYGRLIKLLWSHPISRMQFFWGKLIGQLGIVLLPILIVAGLALLANMIALSMINSNYDPLNVIAKAIVFFIAAAFYLLIFILLGWLISAIYDSESKAILVALTLWTIMVWIWPMLGIVLGQIIKPLTPSRQVQESWQQVVWGSLGSLSTRELTPIVDAPTGREQKLKVIAQLEEKLETEGQLRFERATQEARRLRLDYYNTKRSQTQNTLKLTSLSLFGFWNDLVNGLADAGYRRHTRFVEQVSEFAVDFGKFSDDAKMNGGFQPTYKSVGEVGYGGFVLQQRVGRLYDHVPIPQGEGPAFRWQPLHTVELIVAIPYRLSILSGIAVILTLFNIFALRRMNLE